jgi:hypothetical protein
MHRMTGLAAAAAAALVLGIGIGWMFSSGGEPAPTALEAKAVERELVTGTVAARPAAGANTQPQVAQPQSFPPPAAMAAPAKPAAAMMAGPPAKAGAVANSRCENPDALGISRTVAIDTTGGPGFGTDQFKAHDFLEPGEVVLTFDDGPGGAMPEGDIFSDRPARQLASRHPQAGRRQGSHRRVPFLVARESGQENTGGSQG